MENNENQANQNGDVKPVSSFLVAMPLLQQTGNVFVGPGAVKEAQTIGLGLSKLSTRQKDDLDRAKRYAMEQSIKHVMLKQQISHQEQQKKVAMYSQALSLMARVYIGSISFEIREEQIKQNFSVFGPIKTINMSWDTVTGHHKGFAFLEYEVPEAALLAQETMNGKLVGGRNLKVLPVGRPANMPQAQPIIEMVMQEAKDYNRVYVSSVHPDLSEKDLRMVFEAFGKIIKCQLAKQPGKGHRGFGYLEFESAQAVKEAIDGMNNFDLGGQHLQVGRCITPPDALTYIMPSSQSTLPTASAVAAAAVTAKIQAQEAIGGKSSPNSGMSPNIAASASPTEAYNSPLYDGGQCASPMRSSSPNPIANTASPGSPSATTGGTRRRLGGFAAAPVPSPTVVQPLAIPPPTVLSHIPPPSIVQPPPPTAVVITPVGVATWPTVKTEPKQEPVEDSTAFMAPKFEFDSEPKYDSTNLYGPVPPPPAGKQAPADNFAAPKQPPPKKDIISRIKIKQPKYDTSQRATFAPLPESIAPKDKVKEEELETNGDRLAIEGNNGNSYSTALALREGAGELMKVGKDETKSTGKEDVYRKKKKIKAPKDKRPKLNTPQALAAAEKAGAINDQMQAANAQNEEATIASQENVEIRGNDARHLLMHKLMRTNRSSVVLIKNMVTADQVDDQLDEEIRSECGKYGTIVNIVLAQEEDSSGDVRVFVQYADPSQADSARKAIDKRFFDGKEISAVAYDQILFEHQDYTG